MINCDCFTKEQKEYIDAKLAQERQEPVVKTQVGIFTLDRDRAIDIINTLCSGNIFNIESTVCDYNKIMVITKTCIINWLKPSNLIKGRLVSKAYIDRCLVGTEEYNDIILPACRCKKEDIILVGSISSCIRI